MNVKSSYIIVLITVSLVAILYSQVLHSFFQHDEWQTFATEYLKNDQGIIDTIQDSFLPKASHYSPLFGMTFNLMFSVFGLSYLGYASVSVVLHLISVFLVFFLAYRLINKLILAFIAALLFGLNGSSHQATTWMIANINTHGATIFGLLSFIVFIVLLRKDKKRYWGVFASLFLLIISLMFKEIAIGFFALLPITFLLFAKPQLKKSWKIYYTVILGLGIIYFCFRLLMLIMPVPDSEFIVTKNQSIKEITYNALTFPVKIFAQSVIPTQQLLGVSRATASFLPDFITGNPGTTRFDQFVENAALQGVDFLIFILGVLAVLLVWKSQTAILLKRVILLSFIFIILNSFVYALSPGRSGLIPVIDSRNIYLPAIGTSIFLTTLVYVAMRQREIYSVLLVTPLVLLHMYSLNGQLVSLVNIGTVRREILQQIHREHPDLPEKIVFYVESDTPYYGMAENIPPFETGLGQALLVWYHSTERFPTIFFEKRFLRFITDQGYKEEGNRGFGYFRDISLLQKVLKQNKLPLESVISYSYYGGSNVLQETTIEMREKLKRLNNGLE